MFDFLNNKKISFIDTNKVAIIRNILVELVIWKKENKTYNVELTKIAWGFLKFTKSQNSIVATNRKNPNNNKKVYWENKVENINNTIYTTPDKDLFRLSFILKIF